MILTQVPRKNRLLMGRSGSVMFADNSRGYGPACVSGVRGEETLHGALVQMVLERNGSTVIEDVFRTIPSDAISRGNA